MAERLKAMRKARDDRAGDLQNVSVRTKSASANLKDGISAKPVPEVENMVAEVASAKKKPMNNNKKKKKKGNR